MQDVQAKSHTPFSLLLGSHPKKPTGLLTLFMLGYLLELAGGTFLLFFTSLRFSYMMLVAFHILFGFLLVFLLGVYGIHHIRTLQNKNHTKGIKTGRVVFLSMVVCFALGIYLTFAGVPRQNEWLLYLHIAAGFGAVLLFVVHLRAILPSVEFKSSEGLNASTSAGYSVLSGGMMLIFLGGLLYATIDTPINPAWAVKTLDDDSTPRLSYTKDLNPFFPSLATTGTGDFIPPEALAGSKTCGTKGCHQDLYQQWNSSAHHNASFNNPFYKRTVEYFSDRSGFPVTRFCGGCHDPLLLFSGQMDGPIDPESWQANAGITCISCHSIVGIRDRRGNGSYILEEPKRYPFANSSNGILQSINRMLIRTKPGPHRKTFLKELHRTPDFCLPCHKVHIPESVNGFRWLRGQNEFDAWQDSGVSGYSVRSWYEYDEPKQCQDCHMPEVESSDMGQQKGKVHTHRFLGPNSALPAINGDKEQLEAVKEFLSDQKVTMDIVAIKRKSARGYDTCFLPIEPCGITSGETIIIEAVIRNRGVGHTFPGGTTDSNEVWVEFSVKDSAGNPFYESGNLNEGNYVDLEAHFYKSVLVDRSSQLINKRNIQDWVSTVYTHTIKPGASDVVHYQVTIPGSIKPPVILHAKLHYRKFNQWYTNWVYRGERMAESSSTRIDRYVDEGRWGFNNQPTPDFPIITLSSAQATLYGNDPKKFNIKNKLLKIDMINMAERMNDYGIGLLLQEDFRGALQSFEMALSKNSENTMLRLNLARALLQEGNITAAEKHLRQLLSSEPDNVKVRYFQAVTLIKRGNYTQAIRELENVIQFYPNDRVVQNQLARLAYLVDNYPRADRAVTEVLRIDPEDLSAHYRASLLERAKGNEGRAAEVHEKYLFYKPDEESMRIAGLYRLLNAIDNREAQLIHLH